MDTLSVLIQERDNRWFAHCLERSLLSQSTNVQSAIDNLITIINLDYEDYEKHKEEMKLPRPAGKEYFDLFEKANFFQTRQELNFCLNCKIENV